MVPAGRARPRGPRRFSSACGRAAQPTSSRWGANGVILHSSNDGATWQAQISGTTQALNSVWGSGPNDVFAVGPNGLIVHSSNDGASWQAQISATTQFFTGVWGSGPDDVFVVGSNGVILHRNDPEPSIDADPVFAVLTNNSLWEFGGAGWQRLLSPAGTILSVASVTDGAGQADRLRHHLRPSPLGTQGVPGFPGNGWQILSAGSFQSVSYKPRPTSPAGPSSLAYSPTTPYGNTTPPSAATAGATSRRPAPSCRPTPSPTRGRQRRCIRRHLRQPSFGNTTPAGLVHALGRQFPGWHVPPALTPPGAAVVYGVLTDNSLWEHNPAFAGNGWANLSPVGTVLSASAGGTDEVFAITADQHLWQHFPQRLGLGIDRLVPDVQRQRRRP